MTQQVEDRSPTAEAESGLSWQVPQPEEIPAPTYWPAVLAFGSTLLLWGLVTTWIISLVGLALVTLALAGWIGGIRYGA